jgi:hypothetical protein
MNVLGYVLVIFLLPLAFELLAICFERIVGDDLT